MWKCFPRRKGRDGESLVHSGCETQVAGLEALGAKDWPRRKKGVTAPARLS